LGLSCQSLL